jgi:hypothetical protein
MNQTYDPKTSYRNNKGYCVSQPSLSTWRPLGISVTPWPCDSTEAGIMQVAMEYYSYCMNGLSALLKLLRPSPFRVTILYSREARQ